MLLLFLRTVIRMLGELVDVSGNAHWSVLPACDPHAHRLSDANKAFAIPEDVQELLLGPELYELAEMIGPRLEETPISFRWAIHRGLACQSAHSKILAYLLGKNSEELEVFMICNPNCPKDVLALLAESKSAEVRRRALVRLEFLSGKHDRLFKIVADYMESLEGRLADELEGGPEEPGPLYGGDSE